MYTDEDLNFAISENIFSEESVEVFRATLSKQKNSPSVDEENFRLIGGFNDIFVVIACALLLFSSLWVLESAMDSMSLGLAVFTILSWSLAEFFVLKRKMALPAIVLLLSFVGGLFSLVVSFFDPPSEISFVLAAAITTGGAFCHWIRFKVPITIATGLAAAVSLLVSITLSISPDAKNWLLAILFVCGLLTFFIAMYWDSADTARTTRRSDVAFWLHLLSAPLIIHPVFSGLGVLNGNEDFGNMLIVIVLYILMTLVSIAIDRRIFMVSSLVYVLYALTSLIKAYGGVGYAFALTGVFMGGMLLLLSAFWHRTRIAVVGKLPSVVKKHLPIVKNS